jgi:hypothetical protein
MSAYKNQIGGKHYQDLVIQPTDYIIKNNIPFAEGNVIKYVSRHKQKGKEQDIKKAIHYLSMILETTYNLKTNIIYYDNSQDTSL